MSAVPNDATMEKLSGALNKVMAESMSKWEADSWKETKTVSFRVFKTVNVQGRPFMLKGEWPEQSEKHVRGIKREDALKLGTVVREVTVIERRIK